MKIPLINRNNPLPSAYTPKNLVKVGDGHYLDQRAAYALTKMIFYAKQDGVDLSICSAYRSIEYQKEVFERDVKKYMERGLSREEAIERTSRSIAFPGQSEHNAGLAVDILSPDWGDDLTIDFENTDEFKWLSKNAHKFGFILRYGKGTEDITGISYEPWHYRYVGNPHAEIIKRKGVTLEEYLRNCK